MEYTHKNNKENNEEIIDLKTVLNDKIFEKQNEQQINKLNYNLKITQYALILMALLFSLLLFFQQKNNKNIVKLIESKNYTKEFKNDINIIKEEVKKIMKEEEIKKELMIELTKEIKQKMGIKKEEIKNKIKEENKDIKEIKDINKVRKEETYMPLIEEERPLNQYVYKQELFSNREESFEQAKPFLDNNINGIITKQIPSEPIKDPLVTVIIPVYNCKDYISRAIKSIQNQNMMNIEIILVNDKSTDNTLSIIQKMQKKDQRIKIINNQKNMGTLYSRCIGTFSAKGKYIFPLDNDDMFLDEDVLQTIYDIAEKGNFDIVEFKGVEILLEHEDLLNHPTRDTKGLNHPLNLVLFQPELGNYQIWPEEGIYSYHVETEFLWAKCFRTETYIKTLVKFGEKRYTRYIVPFEDIIMIYAIMNTARSYKFVGKYGIFHIDSPESASKGLSLVLITYHFIYYLDVVIEFAQNRIANKVVLVHLLMGLLYNDNLKDAISVNDDIKTMFISCIDRILKEEKISDELKKEIREKGKQLWFVNYPF